MNLSPCSMAVGGGMELQGVERIYHYAKSVFAHRGVTVNMQNTVGVGFLRQITVIRFGSFPSSHSCFWLHCSNLAESTKADRLSVCSAERHMAEFKMLWFSSNRDRSQVYLGDENSLSLTFNARNEGEGGAYEAELYVVLPPEADYSGIARANASLTQLTCSYETENQTRYLVCDLGNPMKPGTSLWAGLRFTVPRLKDTHNTVEFELQIRSKNANNSESEVVLYELEVVAMADLVNNGPSVVSQSMLEVRCPLRTQSHELLYPVEVATEGPLRCSSKTMVNALKLKLQAPAAEGPTSLKSNTEHSIQRREAYPLADQGNLTCSTVECWQLQCNVGLLERGASVILMVRSRVWAETFIEKAYKQYVLECSVHYKVDKMPYSIPPKFKPVVTAVVWNKPDSLFLVPVWIIILAVLAGLLLLALLIYLLYKMGFFKRSDPYGTTMEKAQLKPQASSEA
ncbi:hypothetical protein INR49_016792 [Caranx melampygus]|nr:hypothetical protein INR49_016792 [Caranx melampygus]